MAFSLSNFKSPEKVKYYHNNIQQEEISYLLIDSRHIMYPSLSLFFAIKGNVRDGHEFIDNAYKQGVRNFVVNDESILPAEIKNTSNVLVSSDVILTLQNIAVWKRKMYPELTTIGITGSNGKTIVKEWLSILLSKKLNIVKTPKSFNSQIGVPLSVWGMNSDHDLAIFEAGISTSNEMEKLERIIKPDIGIFTNLGDAHHEGFRNIQEKLNEKLKLFRSCSKIIFNGDDPLLFNTIKNRYPEKVFSWGRKEHNELIIVDDEIIQPQLHIKYKNKITTLDVNIATSFYVENLMNCVTAVAALDLDLEQISEHVASLSHSEMRMELSNGRDGSLIINDSYTNDRQALHAALEFMVKHSCNRDRIAILTPFNEDEIDVDYLNELINSFALNKVHILCKKQIDVNHNKISFYTGIDQLFQAVNDEALSTKIILIKGSRKYGLEILANKLTAQSHSVSLNIDLNAIENNLSVFASLLTNNASIMPIIKASAYGAGSEEIAKVLQEKGVYSLGVAFADEAVDLRKSGINIPIVVLNADENSYSILEEYNFDFEVYSLQQMTMILQWNDGKLTQNKWHLKIDTGMSRLGFRPEDFEELLEILKKNKLHIGSVFTHLSSSEDSEDDAFTHLQATRYYEIYEKISEVIGYHPKQHLLNSSGIIRFPQYHGDLVRLGIGLYGIDSTSILNERLIKVHTFKAKIIQIKNLIPGDYIGYNRRFKVQKSMKIAILNVGYADGLMRACSNGKYALYYQQTHVQIVGNVCMDMTMIDITDMEHCNVGDEVEIFGKNHPIESMTASCNTIPYEILCGIAPRVKRNYLKE